jgi:ribosomal protein S12 methylthiotransferase accessory factor YcaO
MGFASCYEDNLDARSESLRRFSRQHTKKTEKKPTVSESKKSQRTQPKQSLKPLQQKATHNIRQDICRRELQKTPHVPVVKTRYVTTEEIQRRIQREIIRQSRLKE